MIQDSLLSILHNTADNYKLPRHAEVVAEYEVVVVVIDRDGRYRSCVRETEYPVPRKVYASQDSKHSRFLANTMDKLFKVSKKKEEVKIDFIQQIQQAYQQTGGQEINAVLKFFKKLNAVAEEQVITDIVNCTTKSNGQPLVTFEIYSMTTNQKLLTPKLKKWWKKEFQRQLQERFESCRIGLCKITGQKDIIPNCNPIPIDSGTFISANESAYEYGGYSGLESSHIGLKAGLNISLASDGICANRLDNKNNQHRTKFSIDKNHDILSWFVNPSDCDEYVKKILDHALWSAAPDSDVKDNIQDILSFIKNRYCGNKTVKPDELTYHLFCTLIREKNKNRIITLNKSFIAVEQLCDNIIQWNDDSRINYYVDKIPLLSIPQSTILLSPKSSKKKNKEYPSHICRDMHSAFFDAAPINRYILPLTKCAIRYMITNQGPLWSTLCLLRLALIRKGIDMPNEWKLDYTAISPEFALGCALQLTAEAQHPRSKGTDPKANIAQRFLPMCCSTPLKSVSSLERYFDIYVKRMRSDGVPEGIVHDLIYARTKMINCASKCPVRLNAEQSANVVFGLNYMREARWNEPSIAKLFSLPRKSKKNKEKHDVDVKSNNQTEELVEVA